MRWFHGIFAKDVRVNCSNFHFSKKMVALLKQYISDPMLVKPKCVLRVGSLFRFSVADLQGVHIENYQKWIVALEL